MDTGLLLKELSDLEHKARRPGRGGGKPKPRVRRVRTPGGVEHFDQPIGAIIVPDVVPNISVGGVRVRRARNSPADVTDGGGGTTDTPTAPTPARRASSARGRAVSLGGVKVQNAKEVDGEYEGFRQFRDVNGDDYFVGPGDEVYEVRGFVGADKDDNILVTGDTEAAAIKNLDAWLGSNVQKKPTRKAPAKKPAARQRVTREGGSGRTRVQEGKPLVKMHDATPEEIKTINDSGVGHIKIPPAWERVTVVDDVENATGIIARGYDSKGRSQRVYKKEFMETNAAAKYKRQKVVASKMGDLDKQLAKDVKSRDANTQQTAAVVMIMRKTGMRISSERDRGGASEAYGASTLQARHVQVTDTGTVIFDFSAKKGVKTHLVMKGDPELAEAMRRAKGDKKNREPLFPDMNERDSIEYIRDTTGIDMKNHDLRTHLANVIAAQQIKKRRGKPKTATEYRRWRNEVGDAVAAQLGNNRTQALASYIDPKLFTAWEVE